MEALQKQIIVLNNKVDSIYLLIEQLDRKVSKCSQASPNKESDRRENSLKDVEKVNPSKINSSIIPPSLEHKDVLLDDSYYPKSDRFVEEFSAELQIQRLTAQLTAAYNRIAALEDQLVSKRVNS
ncbi:MAG: hypothetical protein F6K35_27585 [Okeania sp. SIO2H7]|nr:hypothetical protein [Okeania sp. SIO2H7]